MFSESFLRSLRSLQIGTTRRRAGTMSGERRSPRRGRSVEFADYRNYAPGDDPRRVDWNVYARLERPYIKLFEDEQDITVHLLLDDSPSMFWHMDDEALASHSALSAKWLCAAQLTAALAYIALACGDRVVIESSSGLRFGPKRGIVATAGMMAFVEHLAQAPRPKRIAINDWLKRYALNARSGWCGIISDWLDEAGGDRRHGIGLLRFAGLQFLAMSMNPRMHVGHELVEMRAALADHRTRFEEQVHQHGLAAPHIADEVGAGHPLGRARPEQAGRDGGGQVGGDAIENQRGAGLQRIGGQHALRYEGGKSGADRAGCGPRPRAGEH